MSEPEAAGEARRALRAEFAAAPGSLGNEGDLFGMLRDKRQAASAMVGFDFPIGLPRVYAAAAGIGSYPQFLDALGSRPWVEFDAVAELANQITLHRPFYPYRPGGTSREHLYHALRLSAKELRRRCEGRTRRRCFGRWAVSRWERRRWTGGGC